MVDEDPWRKQYYVARSGVNRGQSICRCQIRLLGCWEVRGTEGDEAKDTENADTRGLMGYVKEFRLQPKSAGIH